MPPWRAVVGLGPLIKLADMELVSAYQGEAKLIVPGFTTAEAGAGAGSAPQDIAIAPNSKSGVSDANSTASGSGRPVSVVAPDALDAGQTAVEAIARSGRPCRRSVSSYASSRSRDVLEHSAGSNCSDGSGYRTHNTAGSVQLHNAENGTWSNTSSPTRSRSSGGGGAGDPQAAAVKATAVLSPMLEVQYTPLWAAPEVLQRRPFSPASDVYALACTLYECLTHRAPFWDVQEQPGSFGRVWYITNNVVLHGLRPTLPHGTPPRIRALFEKAWHPDPRHRCTAADMLQELIAMSDTVRGDKLSDGVKRTSMWKASASNLVSFKDGEHSRCIESANGSLRFGLRQFHENVSRASALTFPSHRLVKSRWWRGRKYENCVVGSEVVSFVVSHPELFFFRGQRAQRSPGEGGGASEGDRAAKGPQENATDGRSFGDNNDDEDLIALPPRAAAVDVLRSLEQARLIQHITGDHRFDDKMLFYRVFPTEWLPERWKGKNTKVVEAANSRLTSARMRYG